MIDGSRWYLRSPDDRDTHRGKLRTDGKVAAVCGAVFPPCWYLKTGGPELPGEPPDPEQVCTACCRVMPR